MIAHEICLEMGEHGDIISDSSEARSSCKLHCVCVLWKVLSDVYSFAAYAGSRAELATWQQTSAVVMKIKMGYRTPTRVKLSGWL